MEQTLVEVIFSNPDDFLKIKETLTRIGVPNKDKTTLTQSCHILHKRGKYYIVHFKQMFMLDGKPADFTDEDKARLNYIIKMLERWNLLTIINKELVSSPVLVGKADIFVVPFREKSKWTLIKKYTIGKGS